MNTKPTPTVSRRSFTLGVLTLAVGLGGCSAQPADAAVPTALTPKHRIKKLLVREAVNLNVSPSLALAVAHAESSFDPRAESRVGARGVMQIMPATAMGEYAIHADQLWNPRVNVRLGLHFLKRLIERYDGHVEYALSYYNGGSAVGPPSRPRIIPATRSYVQKVMRLQGHYRRKLSRGEI